MESWRPNTAASRDKIFSDTKTWGDNVGVRTVSDSVSLYPVLLRRHGFQGGVHGRRGRVSCATREKDVRRKVKYHISAPKYGSYARPKESNGCTVLRMDRDRLWASVIKDSGVFET